MSFRLLLVSPTTSTVMACRCCYSAASRKSASLTSGNSIAFPMPQHSRPIYSVTNEVHVPADMVGRRSPFRGRVDRLDSPLLSLKRCSNFIVRENTSLNFYSTNPKTNVPRPRFSFDFFSIRSLLSTPYPFMVYGLGGLIPFMAAPVYMQWTGCYCSTVAYAQVVYGATILSFLGGIAWGDDVNHVQKASMESVGYSILLPLIAWPGILLYPHPSSFGLLITGLAYACVKDIKNKTYPRWLKNLRFLLTSLAALSLTTTLVFRFVKNGKQEPAQ